MTTGRLFGGDHLEGQRLVQINRKSVFSHAEAEAILPVVKRITASFSVKVEGLLALLENLSPQQKSAIQGLEDQVNQLILEWHAKIRKLGAIPKGLWLVDFDSGDGFFCWKDPETKIAFWHSYENGFTCRVPIESRPSAAESFVTPVNGYDVSQPLNMA